MVFSCFRSAHRLCLGKDWYFLVSDLYIEYLGKDWYFLVSDLHIEYLGKDWYFLVSDLYTNYVWEMKDFCIVFWKRHLPYLLLILSLLKVLYPCFFVFVYKVKALCNMSLCLFIMSVMPFIKVFSLFC